MHQIKSHTLPLHRSWLRTADQIEIEFVDSVYDMCENNYDAGGDTIIECYGPEEIINEFHTLDEVKEHCGLQIEQATNTRWGEDNDPELDRSERFKDWQ